MRWAACSGASQTIVIREVSALSLSPTVSDTMMMLRRRKSEATRVRTPGLSWTRATKVWSMGTFQCGFSSEWGMELTGGLGYDGINVLGISNRISSPGFALGLALLQRLPVVIPDWRIVSIE